MMLGSGNSPSVTICIGAQHQPLTEMVILSKQNGRSCHYTFRIYTEEEMLYILDVGMDSFVERAGIDFG